MVNRKTKKLFPGLILVVLIVTAGGCGQRRFVEPEHVLRPDRPFADYRQELAYVHGAPPHGVPGPWVILGYRAGQEAVRRLGIDRSHAWDVRVVHAAPPRVQYTCMLDGLTAATGASSGKLNLILRPVDTESEIETIVSRRIGGETRSLRITYPLSIRDHIRDVDYADFPQWADRLDSMPDEQLFRVDEVDPPL